MRERTSSAHLFDFDQVVETFGKKYFLDDSVSQTNHGSALAEANRHLVKGRMEPVPAISTVLPLKVREVIEASWWELLSAYRTICAADVVKAVIVDLDDTLSSSALRFVRGLPASSSAGLPGRLRNAHPFPQLRDKNPSQSSRLLEAAQTVHALGFPKSACRHPTTIYLKFLQLLGVGDKPVRLALGILVRGPGLRAFPRPSPRFFPWPACRLYRAFKPILTLSCGCKERRDSRVLIPSIPISINIYLDHSRRSQF